MMPKPLIAGKAEELRSEFDRAFAVPFSASAREQHENLLAIRLNGVAYAIKVSEVALLENRRKINAFPGPLPECLGIAGIRGELVPVYSLAMLLGHEREAEPKWLVVCRNGEPAGLAFDSFEGHLLAPLSQLHAAEGNAGSAYIKEIFSMDGTSRPVIDIFGVLKQITELCGKSRRARE